MTTKEKIIRLMRNARDELFRDRKAAYVLDDILEELIEILEENMP